MGDADGPVACVKRVIGREWDETSKEILEALPFKVSIIQGA